MKTKNIKQSISFTAPAHDIYEMIMDSKKHAKLTDSKVKMGKKVGDKFTVYDGQIHGEDLELVPDQKIVQNWRFEYPDWPKDHFSKVTFNLKETKGKTKLLFFHTGIPEKYAKDISDGWREYYWVPMKKLIN
jgi:activator of HSP90 ATPase